MKRLYAWLAVVCLLLGGLLTGCGDDGTGKGFRFPLDAEPRQLDPQVSSDTASVTLLSVLFEGLTRLDADGRAVPGAATWTLSADGLTYTFTLRESYWSTKTVRDEDLPWEEPMPVTAADFVFGIRRALSPETGSALAKDLYGIKNAKAVHTGKKAVDKLGVKAVSDTVLTITLDKPDARFPALLATTPCMPCNQAFFEYTAGRYGLEAAYLLTNGPFVLAAWNHNESLLLNKHEQYHGAAGIAPEAVRFVIGNEVEAAKGLLEGTLDAALLAADSLDEAESAGIQPVALEDSIRSVWFNTSTAPLSNANVRRALRDGIQWDTLYSYLEAAGEPVATGYVAPAAILSDGTVYRTADNARRFSANVKAAQTALGKGLTALYPDESAPALPRLTVLAAEDEVSANLARYLVQSWQKNLSLYTQLELVSADRLVSRVRSGDYQIAIYTHTATGMTGGENLAAYATGAAGNYSRLSSKSVTAACQKALQGGRAELVALEKALRDACPTLPLSFPRRYYGVAAGTEGITVRPFGGGIYGCPFGFLEAKKWD